MVISFLNGLILPDGRYILKVAPYRSIAEVFGPTTINLSFVNGELITPYDSTEIKFYIDYTMQNLDSFELIITDLDIDS